MHEKIETLEKFAQLEFDKQNYDKAAKLYKAIAEEIEHQNNVAVLSKYLMWYGVSCCYNKDYENGIRQLNRAYKHEVKYELRKSGNKYNEAIKLIIYATCLIVSKINLEPSNYRIINDFHALIKKFYYTNYDDKENLKVIAVLSDYILDLCKKMYKEAGPRKLDAWYLASDIIGEYFILFEGYEVLNDIYDGFFEIWEGVLSERKKSKNKDNWNEVLRLIHGTFRNFLITLVKTKRYDWCRLLFNKGENLLDLNIILKDLTSNCVGVDIYTCYAESIWAKSKSIIKTNEAIKIMLDIEWLASFPESKSAVNKSIGKLYYNNRIIGNAIKFFEKALSFEVNQETLKLLITSYYEIDQAFKVKALCLKLLERETLDKESIEYCRKTLAEIYKDEFEYKAAINLYEKLITDSDNLYDKQYYKEEMYRCMPFVEVDTIEVLEKLKELHEQHRALSNVENIETVKDLNALARAYISYANYLKANDNSEAEKYLKLGAETYNEFYIEAAPLVEEALEKKKYVDIIPFVREYATALQGYMELIDDNNKEHLFDLVALYQSFAFEIDRFKGKKIEEFKRDNIAQDICSNLNNKTIVFNYVLYYKNHERMYGVFTLTHKGLEFYELGYEKNVKESIQGFLDALLKGIDMHDIKSELRSKLLPNVIDMDSYSNVFIVRETGLEKVPFHIIYDKNTIDIMTVRTLLDKEEEQETVDFKDITVFADPMFTIKGYDEKVDKYEKLEGTHVEAKVIDNIYNEGSSATSYLEDKANKANFRNEVSGGHSILHIASHHVKKYDYENKGNLESYKLILAGSNNLINKNDNAFKRTYGDGDISAAEISRADIKNKLVVLATCQSSIDAQIGGAGAYGLSRAFYNHGAQVVSSLYDVDDAVSPVFFSFFYRKLKESNNLEEAIDHARKKTADVTKEEILTTFEQLAYEDEYVNEYLNKIDDLPDKSRPFKHEKYWSGYVLGR